MIGRLLLILLLLLPVPAVAQSPAGQSPARESPAAQSLAGSWALRVDGAVIMRFDLARDGAGWKGAWAKPSSFASDGKRFARISLPAVELASVRASAAGDWTEIVFEDAEAGPEPVVFRFRQTGPDRAEMLYVGTGLAPFTLQRVAADAPLGPFVEGRVYGEGSGAAPRSPPPVQGPPAFEGR